jgi:hypothetical protein
MAEFSGLLVKVRGDGKALQAALAPAMAGGAPAIELVLRVPARPAAGALASAGPATWLRVRAKGTDARSAWDQAHDLLDPSGPFAAAPTGSIELIEPDLEQPWDFQEAAEDRQPAVAGSPEEFCGFDEQDQSGGKAPGPSVAWNLGESYSQLAKARARVGAKLEKILVAHLPGSIPRMSRCLLGCARTCNATS